jgi:prefoldin subunit 5
MAGLKEQADLLQNQLEALNARIAELSKEPQS